MSFVKGARSRAKFLLGVKQSAEQVGLADIHPDLRQLFEIGLQHFWTVISDQCRISIVLDHTLHPKFNCSTKTAQGQNRLLIELL
jgi:hypothetical protein